MVWATVYDHYLSDSVEPIIYAPFYSFYYYSALPLIASCSSLFFPSQIGSGDPTFSTITVQLQSLSCISLIHILFLSTLVLYLKLLYSHGLVSKDI